MRNKERFAKANGTNIFLHNIPFSRISHNNEIRQRYQIAEFYRTKSKLICLLPMN